MEMNQINIQMNQSQIRVKSKSQIESQIKSQINWKVNNPKL